MLKKFGLHIWSICGILFTWFLMVRDSWKLPFSLIDDPQFADKYTQIKAALFAHDWPGAARDFFVVFPGTKEGRFAPVFWFSYLGRFFVADLNPFYHHFLHSILILMILVLIYLVVWQFTKKRLYALLSVAFFCILSPGFENWYRISTQEPIQLFCLLLLIYSLKKSTKLNWSTVIVSILFLLSKEISLLFFPFFVLWFLIAKKPLKPKLGKFLSIYTLLSFAFAITLFLIMKLSTWSASNASVSFVWPSTIAYFGFWRQYQLIYLLIFGLTICALFFKSKYKESLGTAILFLGFALNGFVALLPWKYPLVRFMFTQKLGLAIFCGITIGLFSTWCYQQIRYKSVIGVFGLAMVLLFLAKVGFANIQQSSMFTSNYLAWEISNGQLLSQVSTFPLNSELVINVSQDNTDAHEWVERMPLYLKIFQDREDIKVDFIDSTSSLEGYLANWSVYSLADTQLTNRIWSTSLRSHYINTSLKSFLLSLLMDRPIYGFKEYRWDLYSI